jgi:hypothetical protein
MVAPSVDQPVSLYVFPSMCFALWVSPLSETGRRPVPGPFCALRLGFRGRGVRRFGGRADAPYVLFICQDDAQRDDFLARADRELTGHRWHPLRPADQHEYTGRRRILFGNERDAHQGHGREAEVRGVRLPRPAGSERTSEQLSSGAEPTRAESSREAG